MQEDNLYVKSTEKFLLDEPVEQADERELEAKEVFQVLPQLQAVIDSLQASIDFYLSPDAISEDVLTNPQEFMHVVAGYKVAVDVLRKEINRVELLIRNHTES